MSAAQIARFSHSLSGSPFSCLPDAVPCGSELARDSGRTLNINAKCDDAIASKLAPTLDCGPQGITVAKETLPHINQTIIPLIQSPLPC
ncbi:hypothetical protein PS874_01780 [Pseudomonas fluorescens]|nr:hypothetical protein PS874_01780 [Pseudomonas fluorescens]